MDERSKKRQTMGVIGTLVPTVHVGESSGSGGHGHSVSITTTRTKNSGTTRSTARHEKVHRGHGDQSIGNESKVRQVQGVSLDAYKRELQRFASDSADDYFRDKQVEASDALIDEIGSLLTESGWAQIIETAALDRFAAEAGDLRLRPGFASHMDHMKVSLGISARTAM